MSDYETRKVTVTLTNHQKVMLDMYLRITASSRKETYDTYKKLSEELDEFGQPCFKSASGNAEWYEELNRMIEEVLYPQLSAIG